MNAAVIPMLPTKPKKPTAPKPRWEKIHAELIERDQWVNWRYAERHGEWSKVPYTPNGQHASSTDTATWSTFQNCRAACEICGFDGVGYVFSEHDPFIGIDLDHCLISDDLRDWAVPIFGSAKDRAYIEVSPGSEGLHIICRGPQGFKGRKKNDVEIYSSNRFFTVTGESAWTSPSTIGECPEVIRFVLSRIGITPSELMGASSAQSVTPTRSTSESDAVDDATIIIRARNAANGAKFIELYDRGDISDYGDDESRADMALAAMLAFWTGPNVGWIERLMRASKLNRPKWNQHKTYLVGLTITKVLAGMSPKDFYDWSKNGRVGAETNPAMQRIIDEINHIDHAARSGLPSSPKVQFITACNGNIQPNVANVILLLNYDPDLSGMVRFDKFSDRLIINKPIPDEPAASITRQYPRLWSDGDTVGLQAHLQRRYIPRIPRNTVEDALTHIKPDCAFHPVREYLNSISWDGIPRINDWLITYLNADTSGGILALKEVGPKFLISAIARIFQPGCKVDHMLVLEGEQGIGKSSALAVLATEEWFSDSLSSDLDQKDTVAHLRGKWIVEMTELAQLQRSKIETVKAYLTRQVDKYRPVYGRAEVEYPRQCVFTGSTNSDSYLVDPTGNRRFWVVKCGLVDLDGLRRDRDQLWAEAVARFRAGEAWHVTNPAVLKMLSEEAAKRTITDPWFTTVAEILEKTKCSEIAPGEILNQMIDLRAADKHKGSAARVSGIMRDIGWTKGRRHCTRGQLYYRPDNGYKTPNCSDHADGDETVQAMKPNP